MKQINFFPNTTQNKFIYPLLATVLIWLILLCNVLAGTGDPDTSQLQLFSRDVLIRAIQERGEKDLELNKAAEGAKGLEVLFKEHADAVHMHMTDVLAIYEKAYEDAKASKSISDKIQNELYHNPVQWILLFIIGLIGVTPFLWRRIIAFCKWLAEKAYKMLAGYRPFWSISLKRYRKSLERNYHQLKLIFRPERPLNMQEIYVPLRVAGSKKHEPIDAYKAIQKHKNLVVVGAPGAGKTMLMNHLALTYARQGLQGFVDRPVPVLLQLNRLNGSEKALKEHLKEVLERHNFPKGKSFIESFLKSGKLLLLFDGLDEVNTEIRENVAKQIKDLLQKYPENRAIVSCRTQVYKE